MLARTLYALAVGDAGDAPRGEPRRFSIHALSLMLTKTADGLIDPKLVLAWLLGALGAPGVMVGALVPVREAGALLPQLALAGAIQRLSHRKWAWVWGSAVQGLAACGIAVSAFTLEGWAAGATILACLAILAVARSACSASYKDIAARTLEKGTRGTVSGLAGSVASAAVLAFAALIAAGVVPLEPTAIALAIATAGGLWIVAAVFFAGLDEEATGDAEASGFDPTELVRPLVEDSEFRVYIATRGLLIATALAPPFIVLLSGQGAQSGLGNLGVLMIASAAASITASYVWGRFADRSSRRTLAVSGGLAAVVFAIAAAMGFLTGGAGGPYAAAGFVFAAGIAYEGARAGRKTHLTDMDTGDQKTVYTALSNSVIGVMLLIGGAAGWLSDVAGPEAVLALFSGLAALAVPVALGLSEVQNPEGG